MILVYTVLFALPIGLLIHRRSTAILTYLAVGAWVFTFQTTSVLLGWLAHEGRSAFGPFPSAFPAVHDSAELYGYAAVNLVIAKAGVGLVVLGGRLHDRRARKGREAAARGEAVTVG